MVNYALELWVATSILTSLSLNWTFYSNANAAVAPSLVAVDLSPSTEEDRASIDLLTSPVSHRIIFQQLQAGVEKRGAALAKMIMNELERRLLQRHQSNRFETLIVATILLACVERMCWFFQRCGSQPTSKESGSSHSTTILEEHKECDTTAASATNLEDQPPVPNPVQWPFNVPPSRFSQQGDRFSDILLMLLKMRGIIPRLDLASRSLSQAGDEERSIDAQPREILQVVGSDADPAATAWFEAVAITPKWLEERQRSKFDRHDERCWEGKYIAKMLDAAWARD